MPKTYEQTVGQELDTLYQGALFLSGGNRKEAEWLLIGTVVGAFPAEGAGRPDITRWLEAQLASRFLGSTVAPPPAPTRTADIESMPDIRADDLFRAVAAVPSWARAALWLVLLREWSYAEAGEALGVSIETIRRMLDYRHLLVREVLRTDQVGGGAEASVT